MVTLICDVCKQPMMENDICSSQGYRFKGSYVCIRANTFGRKKEVEEIGETFDLCQACYNTIRNMCKEKQDVDRG